MSEKKSITLSDVQKKMLTEMLTWREYCYGYWQFDIQKENGEYLDKKELRKEMKPMLDIGIVKHVKGLMNDDGEVCGSGFSIVEAYRENIEKALGKYIEETEVLELMKKSENIFVIKLAELFEVGGWHEKRVLKDKFSYYFEQARWSIQKELLYKEL